MKRYDYQSDEQFGRSMSLVVKPGAPRGPQTLEPLWASRQEQEDSSSRDRKEGLRMNDTGVNFPGDCLHTSPTPNRGSLHLAYLRTPVEETCDLIAHGAQSKRL